MSDLNEVIRNIVDGFIYNTYDKYSELHCNITTDKFKDTLCKIEKVNDGKQLKVIEVFKVFSFDVAVRILKQIVEYLMFKFRVFTNYDEKFKKQDGIVAYSVYIIGVIEQ